MYTQALNSKSIPKVENTAVYPHGYILLFVDSNSGAKLKLEKTAKRIQKHFEMVETARALYKEGKVISWDKFIENA